MLALLIAAQVAGSMPLPAPTTPKAVTAQDAFNAATAARDAGQHAEAIEGFANLEARPAMQRNPAVLGIIRIRKGLSLLEIGRLAEAEAAIDAGLKTVPADASNYKADVADAHIALGRMLMARFDYPRAATHFEQARASDVPAQQITALSMLAYATMFDPGDQAVRYADEAIALTTAQPSGDKDKKALATLRTVYARALLNEGRKAEAYTILKKALTEQGGLDYKVNLGEVVTRSDLAITALLNGDDDSARKYMAYTGAGRFEKAPFATAAHVDVPACGGPADLRPDDVAIVEFSVRLDGQVGYATPIYVSRKGPAAAEFARAVLNWSWKPEDAKLIPELFRAVTRVELRCSNNVARPLTSDTLASALAAWIHEKSSSIANDAGSLDQRKRKLAESRASGKLFDALLILIEMAHDPIASADDQRMWYLQALDIATSQGAPVAARAFLEISAVSIDWEVPKRRQAFRAMLLRPEVVADARTSATLRLLIAEPGYRFRAVDDAEILLTQVANDGRLTTNDPLKVAAFVRLAAIEAARGDLAGARASYARTGLSAEQCGLIDAKPGMLRANAGSADFPMEALRWGFEGWTKVEYDIEASGKTARPRAIIAYPPFVFRDTAVRMAGEFKYTSTYRPAGGLSCSGEQQNIRFNIPSQHSK